MNVAAGEGFCVPVFTGNRCRRLRSAEKLFRVGRIYGPRGLDLSLRLQLP